MLWKSCARAEQRAAIPRTPARRAQIAGVVSWQVAARTARAEPGSFSSSGAGATLPDCVPGDSIWAMFGAEEDVVVVQTVRNLFQWPVMVISPDPEVYRPALAHLDRDGSHRRRLQLLAAAAETTVTRTAT